MTTIGTGVSRGFEALGNSVSWIVSRTRTIANDIANSFAKVAVLPQYKSNSETHHIVAQNAARASKSRRILKAVGIDINSDENKISIKTGLHRRLHRNLYYEWVNILLENAYNSAKGNKLITY